ncbi:nucleotide exchange factor GrpE [Bacillus sp. 2205SS5-2]|uniref:nucleotide exchange factor GrpE n=1 Tax=Bacillus sp. 2205SS5-2 TaxID=3109031 RepID=UPI003FA5F5E0
MNEETKNEQPLEEVEVETEVVEPIFDETEEAGKAEGLSSKVSELEEKLVDEETRYLRLRADFDNFRRRVNLDREASEKYRAQSVISDILPALDNFERALNLEPDNEQTKTLLQGMDMVYRSLTDALTKEGLTAIQAVDQPFDPNLHQAVMQVEDTEKESNIVLEEFQKGYKLKDRVLRPAMVKVNQ